MNELDDITSFLRAHAPFDLISTRDLAALAKTIEVSYHRSGTELLAVDAENTELHMIRRGAVALFDANRRLVAKRADGRLFGYPSMLSGQPTQLAARTVEDSLIYHMPGEAIRALRADYPDFDQYFSAALSQRLQLAQQQRRQDAQLNQAVRSAMSSPAMVVAETQSIAETAKQMAASKRSSVLVVDSAQQLKGIFTDRDLRNRVVAADLDSGRPVIEVMTPDPNRIEADQSLMEAMLLMTDRHIHHLPVTDRGELAGMLTLTDVFSALNNHPVYFAARIRRQPDPAGVATVARQRFELLAQLIEIGASSEHIGRIMTAITDAATRRLIELAEAELGPASMDYAWLAFGSQARREQTGRTDQDNGILLAEEAAPAQTEYFARLGEFVCSGLDQCGFVYCPGEIMASNPKWRLSLAGWRKQFNQWIDEPEPKPLMYASIFFDLRCIAGSEALTEQLRQHIFERTAGNTIFLRFMAGNALSFRPPLGFFRQFTLEADGEHGEQGINLKQRGVVPIVSLARVRALERGIGQPETVLRLQSDDDDALASLRDALELIGEVRLRHQLQQFRQGQEPTNLVDPGELSALVKRNLKAAFRVVADAQQALVQRYPRG